MARKARRSATDGIYDPNLTPLIDVSLVLVVILLVATPMALQSGIAVARAGSVGKAAEMARDARIEINVVDNDRVEINRVMIRREHLSAMLQPLIAQSPTHEVVVSCSDEVAHGVFVSVLDEAKAQGAGRIAVVGR